MPSSSSTGDITEPNPNDVLSSGSTKSDNLGNDRLREYVRGYLEAYRTASGDGKRHIVDSIIDEIHNSGGRFLQKKKGAQTWSEIPLSKVREKIGQRFRNHSRQRKSTFQQAQEGFLIADMPRSMDVLFGRTHERTTGTALFHDLIKEKMEEYVAANRSTKVVVVDKVIERIQIQGGRFLQPSNSDPGRFVELSSIDSIRERISTYFRNYRRPTKKMAMARGP